MPARQLTTDEILQRAKNDPTIAATPPEIIDFRRCGGSAVLDTTTAEIDAGLNTTGGSAAWRRKLLNAFRRLKRIRRLDMRNSSVLMDKFVQSISDGSALRSLALHGTDLTNSGLKHILCFPRIESLDVSGTQITDRGWESCADLPHLSHLSLSCTPVANAGLRALSCAPNLQSLDLSYTNVTDRVTEYLRALTRLATVNLSHTLVSNAAAESLAQLVGLRCIRLTGSLFSSAGIQRMAKLRPTLQIEWSRCLEIVGYWCDSQYAIEQSSLIHPSEVVDAQWKTELRPRIIRYLQEAPTVGQYLGYSKCRFGCGQNASREQSDGHWLWPEGLAHYVEEHSVRLPEKFVAHMSDNAFAVPGSLDENRDSFMPRSMRYWSSWCRQQRAAQGKQ